MRGLRASGLNRLARSCRRSNFLATKRRVIHRLFRPVSRIDHSRFPEKTYSCGQNGTLILGHGALLGRRLRDFSSDLLF
jgi:hypothetical protein